MSITRQNKFLIVCAQGNGNVILALPIAGALKLSKPGCRITFLVANSRVAKICSEYSYIDHVIVVKNKGFGLVRQIYKEGFDMALFAYPSAYRSHFLPWLARVPKRVGHKVDGRPSFGLTTKIDPLPRAHDLQQNMEMIKAIGVDFPLEKLWPPLSEIPQKYISRAKKYLKENGLDSEEQYLGIHTGSDPRYTEKRYPPEHFAKIAGAIYKSHGLKTIVFDGPAESGTGHQVASATDTPVHSLAGWGDLTDAWGLMSVCNLFISNDSGLMNLAQASGVCTIGIFGPSEVHRTRPFMGQFIQSDMDCAPCFSMSKYSGCKFDTRLCMDGISPDKIIRAANEVLDK